ncbi:MAG: hypothetical protein WA862_08030 [Solirubrobacterales bacterium]
MAFVDTIRHLWGRKLLVGLVLGVAVIAALFSAYRFDASPPGLEKRALSVAAASSQILVDSTDSPALVKGVESGTFEANATRAKIYAQYLAGYDAREKIAQLADVPVNTLATSGPFSGPEGYASQPSEERAGELLTEDDGNRVVYTAQEDVPIITVDAQATTADTAIALAAASYTTLKDYIQGLNVGGKPVRDGVAVRELGAPEGGTLGGSNNILLMILAFVLVFGLGCAAILLAPTFAQRWRALDKADYDEHFPAAADSYPAPVPAPASEPDAFIAPPYGESDAEHQAAPTR